ncbi:discoidin domain-containing protein [Acinetobacter radioresistens]|uniref:discoidin domain-containing protein n=1 Tax=Acinetobacter radioresistens TaxID=40216 RepID=UPI0021CD6753|nr:discoidin domain-containing protein [Acinetobacter radioresistens]MCU4310428.1 discoidin domain-containing protein [Acinetobacter radioresistens]
MTNRLELNWELDGFVDEQRYYCSETPIDTANLPVPKAVLASDVRIHTDVTVELGKMYHVCISSVKNNVEKFSNQVSIKVPDAVIAYRYIRILITAIQARGDAVAIQEIEITQTENSADITTPSMTATASAAFYPAKDAFNNNSSSMWMALGVPTQSNPTWIKIDMGEIREFAFLKMRRIGQQGYDLLSPRNFIIQGSNDNADWVDIATYNNVDPWPSDYKFLIFDLKNSTYQ